MKQLLYITVLTLLGQLALAQKDSSVTVNKNIVTLKEVVVRSNLNVPAFIQRIEADTTFYKAFRNLKVLGYSAINDIRMLGKKEEVIASLNSKTTQHTAKGCRWMETLSEQTTGNMYTKQHRLNYYTAELYAGLFFATDTICGEDNIVKGSEFKVNEKSGIEKHKEQLKMLFFNPGKKIPGIPFIGNKIALFDEEVAKLYDFVIDMDAFHGEMCYIFRVTPRQNLTGSEKNQIVINEMTTWFRVDNWEIVARSYDLSYGAGVYNFDVSMEVEMTKFQDLLVPKVMRYNGSWNVILKKKEKGIFTATLFDFTRN
ncbi:MAG: hypothetical protein P0Y53_22140 [Candidatus Pseudobacter hemicellulosilyticus]|uniref:Uncharacterized protein n=1 Tax=Candidatus Pseudobacter hemicellulosilyticus TaxID=3121375 RepID=A0AAJ5WQ51_9BACT|nr:MAG: hypothetical protein P0Y53_22140 [Pseudobacter sp.]